ncbi:MAG: SLOG family protein [Bacteroidota bacterium]
MQTILITGSRNFKDKDSLSQVLCELLATLPKEAAICIAHGGAKGADQIADEIAVAQNFETLVIAPNYDKYDSKAAPLMRNTELVKIADYVIAAYGPNRDRKGGTWDTAKKAIKANKLLVELMSNGAVRKTVPAATLF